MAKKKLSFPFEGKNVNFAASTQPEFTSPDLNNVRPFDVLEGRARGGQRPGMRKVFQQDIGNGTPVVKMCQVTTVVPLPVDTTAPTPDPATFAVLPAADSDTAISMTATTGSDPDGPVEYYFTETSGNPGGSSSGWQASASYTDTGLTASTQYTYTVKMRDVLGNIGTASAPASATTMATSAVDTNPPPVPVWDQPVVQSICTQENYDLGGCSPLGTYHTLHVGSVEDPEGNGPVEYYFENIGTPSTNSGWITDAFCSLVIPDGGDQNYRCKARDSIGNESSWSTTITWSV